MSAVVRRLSNVSPEVVIGRRSSSGVINFPSQHLEVGRPSSISHERRASVGPSDAACIFPNRFLEKENRASRHKLGSENALPSADYLSRKRASIDNTWLSQWIPTSDALLNSTDSLATKIHHKDQWRENKNSPYQQVQRNQVLLTSSNFNDKRDLSTNFENASNNLTSPALHSVCVPLASPLRESNIQKYSPINLSFGHDADDLCDCNKLDINSSGSSTKWSKNFSESPLFTPYRGAAFDSTVCNVNLLSPHNLRHGHTKEITNSERSCCHHSHKNGATVINSSKARGEHRKWSSPSLAFRSLSPCIEDKSKSDRFVFNISVGNESRSREKLNGETGIPNKEDDSRIVPLICVETIDKDESCSQETHGSANVDTSLVSLGTESFCQDQISECVHCVRRRHSLGTQSCNICKKVKNTSQPSTPQPWQIQHYKILWHHRMLNSSGMFCGYKGFGFKRNKTTGHLFPEFNYQTVGTVIGRGGFGVVKLGCYKGIYVAIKVLKGERAALSALKEACALEIHPYGYLNTTYAVVTPTAGDDLAKVTWAVHRKEKEEILPIKIVASRFGLPVKDATYESPLDSFHYDAGLRWAWVISELCTPYTLLTLINDSNVTLSTRDKVRFIGEITSGLVYLHSQGLKHLDVKPANALLSQSGHLRLTDFGCCTRIGKDNDKRVLGTVNYQAPEVLRGQGGSDRSDIYSLGVTIWHLLNLVPPYQGLHPHVIMYQVTRLHHRPSDHHSSFLNEYSLVEWLLSNISERCWAEDPTLRPSAATLSASLSALSFSAAS